MSKLLVSIYDCYFWLIRPELLREIKSQSRDPARRHILAKWRIISLELPYPRKHVFVGQKVSFWDLLSALVLPLQLADLLELRLAFIVVELFPGVFGGYWVLLPEAVGPAGLVVGVGGVGHSDRVLHFDHIRGV